MPSMEDTRDTREKKQVPLRLASSLYRELAAWAEEDFRSVNGQIEYLLTECVRTRRRKEAPGKLAEPPAAPMGEAAE